MKQIRKYFKLKMQVMIEQNPKTQVKSGSSYPVMAFAMLRRTRRPGSSSREKKGRKRDERRNSRGF